ncbi:MAG: intracellular multiplication protein IcmV [uncultured bacterium]|nr:MAG: intracellular multiplication protein IcmV [uncultured bacterium]
MALKDVVKVSRRTFFNPRGWSGYDLVKAQFAITWNILKNLFTPQTPLRQETFEEAMKRMHLSEEMLQDTSRNYLIFAYVFALFGLLTLVFSFYLLFHHGTAAGWILGLFSTALFFVFGFRYHFWHFQIKHRKLGCTFQEWRAGKTWDHEGPSS